MPAWLEQIVVDAHVTLMQDPEAAPARQYLLSRGVTPELMASHRLGFVRYDQPIETCTEAFQKWSWALPHRLLFPFTSVFGDVIGIQTRSLDAKDYQLFYAYPHGLHPYAFGMSQCLQAIWERRAVIITEGVFDYFALRHAAPNVLSVVTAMVPSACRHFFHRYVKRVVACLDMDTPGRTGAWALATRDDWQMGYSVAIPEYAGHDPSELWTKGRLDELHRIAAPALEVARW